MKKKNKAETQVETKWAYSLDEETFSGRFATQEEAKAEAMVHIAHRGDDPNDTMFWVGECFPPSHEDLAYGIGEYVEDNLACAATDIWDGAEYPGNIAKDIQVLIEKYLNKNVPKPEFSTVENIVKYNAHSLSTATPKFTIFKDVV